MTRLVPGILLAVLFSATLAAQPPSDWPQFRGPTGQGVSADKGVPTTWSKTENIAWKADLPGPGTSSPIIIGSKIFVTCYTGYAVPGQARGNMDDLKLRLVCLKRENGEHLWTKDVEPRLPEQPTIREDHGYSSSTPAADAEGVYCFFGKSGVVAFDHNGQQLWRTEVGSQLHGWGSGTSPVLFGDLVIVNASVESESVVALNKKTGKEVWRRPRVVEAWNTPILVDVPGGKTELVVAAAGRMLGVDPATGRQLWSCDTDIRSYMVPGPVAHEGVVYCIGGRANGGVAVKAGGSGDVTATHRLWTIRKGSNVTSPIYHDGHLYWMNDNQGTAYCAEAKTGKIVYEHRVERADQVYASPVLADGKLYYLSRSGKTYVVAAKTEYELLAVNDLSDRTVFNASPAIAAGKMYIRTSKVLYCIGQK